MTIPLISYQSMTGREGHKDGYVILTAEHLLISKDAETFFLDFVTMTAETPAMDKPT
jgi:hypothetical protein